MYAYVYRIHIPYTYTFINTRCTCKYCVNNNFMKICYISRQIIPGHLLLCHSASQCEEAFK